MPDLTVEVMSRCTAHIGDHEVASGRNPDVKYTVTFYPDGAVWCTCPGMKYHHAKNLTCKHVDQVMDGLCGWNELAHGGTVNEHGRCPNCDGPVEQFRAAV